MASQHTKSEVKPYWSTYVRINEKTLIIKYSGRKVHHLRKNEQILEIMGDFFRDELHEVRYQLMEAWVTPYTG